MIILMLFIIISLLMTTIYYRRKARISIKEYRNTIAAEQLEYMQRLGEKTAQICIEESKRMSQKTFY